MSEMIQPRASRLRREPDGTREQCAPARLRQRALRGFTMVELMVVIAILAIMAGIGFVAITQIQKNMQQTELDGTAKELFIAAQNHLTTANAQGTLQRKTDKGTAAPGENGVYYYYAVNGSAEPRLAESNALAQTSVLYQMLPFGAIDETIRTGGTYVIKYDLDNAQVIGVFYARSSYSSLFAANTEGFAFTDEDYSRLFPAMEGDGAAQARQNYASASGPTVMIGYYGGEDLDGLESQQIEKPRLRVDNAERLTATVINPNGMDAVSGLRLSLRLIVTGVTSGKSKAITLINQGNVTAGSALSYVEGDTSGSRYVVHLDDITKVNGSFASIFGSDGLIPGEDVRIQAVMSSTTALTNVAKSASMRRNSLFGSVYSERETVGVTTTTTRTARISNIRHLENLSYGVSGYDPLAAVPSQSGLPATNPAASWSTFAAKSAVQVSDLSWSDFRRAIKPADPTTVWVYEGSLPTWPGSFAPVNPERYELNYDGRNHRITDVTVNHSLGGSAGLFGSLTKGSVKDLELVNFSMNARIDEAGALAGTTNGTVISGVAAYNELSDDSALGITGGTSAGGLVGTMTGGSITDSAAAVYVHSANGDAGGLVGQVNGTAAISSSYAGGHTLGGKYSDSTVKGAAGRMNVIAAANAGGLVGNATGGTLSVNSCYSTASVQGNAAGGLIGNADNETVNNSYAIGLVVGASESESTAGALVGQMSGGTLTSCTYLETVNNEMGPVGSGSVAVTPADANLAAYNAFSGSGALAYPYDGALVRQSQGVYPYKTIADLTGAASGAALPLHITSHYGDWPVVETLVVNRRS